MRPKTAHEVKDYLEDVYKAIISLADEDILSGPKELINKPFLMLDKIAAFNMEDKDVERLLKDQSIVSMLQSISNLRQQYGLRLEIEQALAILNSPDPWKTLEEFVFYANYQKLAGMESRGAELNKDSKVVFLGSGPLPLSLISLSRRYGIMGIGIEQALDRVDISQKVIEHLGLSSCIQILRGNHLLLPLKESVQLIMIAAAAKPKNEIFAHLAKTLPRGTKVSYRIFKIGLRRILDSQKDFIIPLTFREYRRIHPMPPVNNTAIFLITT